WYFMGSPFFDPQSNNLQLFNDSFHMGQEGVAIKTDRKRFEHVLQERFRTGVQFIVTAEPQEPGQPWVIQRQNRQEVEDPDGTMRIETKIEGTFFTLGTVIRMAPSLLDIIRSNLLAITVRLQSVFDICQGLETWSPSTGHTYLPPTYEDEPQAPLGAGSRAASPGPSEAGAVSMQPLESITNEFNDDFFCESLALANRYGNEYMDENPLQGEPGAFVFTSTTQQVEARNKALAEAQASAAASSSGLGVPIKNEPGLTPSSSVAPTPKPTPAALDAASRKASVANKAPQATKKERRKSKGVVSPTSPTAPTLG
ncbi:hypothetical protein EJ04DRAFT_413594, partial [Polyplosphaeria fusca]